MTLNYLLVRIDANQNKINSRRPHTAEEVRELDAYYKIGTTYSSNALEGNSLTLTETKVLLEDGITTGGKPVRDCYEATGHARAYDYMLTLPSQYRHLTFSANYTVSLSFPQAYRSPISSLNKPSP